MPSTECRFAHIDGLTSLTCIDSCIITGGADGDFRIYKNPEDDDPKSESGPAPILCMSSNNDSICVAYDNCCLQKYSFTPTNDKNGSRVEKSVTIRTKFQIYCMDFVGDCLYAGLANFTILRCKFRGDDYKMDFFEGHVAPVLSVSVDYLSEFAASSSCDGSLRIWRISDLFCEMHIAGLFPKTNDINHTKPRCCVQWNNYGTLLAVTLAHCVRFYQRDTWDVQFEFTSIDPLSLCSFSYDDKFVVTVSISAEICIWSCRQETKLKSFQFPNQTPLSALSFYHTNYVCIFADYSGSFGSLDFTQDLQANDIEWDDDMNIDKIVDLSDDDLPVSKTVRNVLSDDDLPVDAPQLKDDVSEEEGTLVDVPQLDEIVGVPQISFQPGSTPSFLSERYMAWNHVGIVRQNTSEENGSIDVEFHDSSISHSLHVYNPYLYSIADVSANALLLASNSDTSLLYCMLINTWDRSKEWSLEMTQSESIDCVALTDDWLAVVTSKRLVRVFTLPGLEIHVFSVPGKSVCSVALKSRLVVVYHKGIAQKGDQSLGFLLYDITLTEISPLISSADFPISSESVLTWAGFSTRLYTCDSKGIVRCMFLRDNGGHWWTEICDVSGSIDDNNWVIGVDEEEQRVRYVRSGSKFPPLFPKPIVLFMPFRLSVTHSAEFQEGIIRSNIFPSYGGDESSLAIQLVALLCKEMKDRRAFDVVRFMLSRTGSQTMSRIFGSLALKYAEKSGHKELAKRINELLDSVNGEKTTEDIVSEETRIEQIMAPRTIRLSSYGQKQLQDSTSQSFASQVTVDDSFDDVNATNPFKTNLSDSSATVDDFNNKIRRACQTDVAVDSKRQKRLSAFDVWLDEKGNAELKGKTQLLSDFSKLSSEEKKFWKEKAASIN